MRVRITTAGLLFFVLLPACSGSGTTAPPPGTVPEFQLTDVSPNSATSGTDISPRDYVGNVSAWYFGSAT